MESRSDRLNARLRFALTLAALLAGLGIAAARYARFVDMDLNFTSYVSPEAGRFGDQCYLAVGEGMGDASFDDLRGRPLPFKPVHVPYKTVEPAIFVPAGGYLVVRCALDLSELKKPGFGWIELGPLAGPTAVWLDQTKKLEQADGERAGFPLLPEERKAGTQLTIVSKGHADRESQPGPSGAGYEPFFTDDRADLERQAALLDSTDRFSYFHLGYALTLLMVFSIAWLYGMRYPDVSWMIIIAALLAARSVTLLTQGGPKTLVEVQSFHLVHTVLSTALPCFVYSFFRFNKRWFSPEVLTLAVAVVAGVLYFGFMDQLKRALGFEIVLPLVIGAVLLGGIGVAGVASLRGYTGARKRRVAEMTGVALVGAALYANSAFAYVTSSWSWTVAFDLYLPYLVTSVFACFLAYDLVIYHRNYFAEKAARLEAERENAKNEAIAKTTQMVAHDVRKPFSLLKVGLDMLRQAGDIEQVRRTLGRLAPEVERAVTSVNGMLADVMEIGASRPPETEPVMVEALVGAALTEVFRLHAKADVALKYGFTHQAPVAVATLKIQRVLSNIIENAVQAMSGKGTLWFVTKERVEDGRRFVELAVGNDGPEIPADALPQLFEAFYTKGKKAGTGLGLAIAKKIVEGHGGKIWAVSQPPRRTEFILTLPVAEGAARGAVPPLPTRGGDTGAPSDAPPPAPHGKPEVIMVEDSPFVSEAWEQALTAVQVHVFTTPEALLRALERDPGLGARAACVITDQHFDDSATLGTELALLLRTDGRVKGKIFLCSNSREISDEERRGLDGLLEKEPVDWPTLARRL